MHSRSSEVSRQGPQVWLVEVSSGIQGQSVWWSARGQTPQKWGTGVEIPESKFLLSDKQFWLQFCALMSWLHDLCSRRANLSKNTDDKGCNPGCRSPWGVCRALLIQQNTSWQNRGNLSGSTGTCFKMSTVMGYSMLSMITRSTQLPSMPSSICSAACKAAWIDMFCIDTCSRRDYQQMMPRGVCSLDFCHCLTQPNHELLSC